MTSKSQNILPFEQPPKAHSKSPRICHISDIHLGYRRYNKVTKLGLNQREVDVNLAFNEAIGRVISLKPDITIIAGDLFHSVRPSNSVVAYCFRQLRRLREESGAPVVLVGGNHESPKRVDTGSPLQIFAEIEGVFVSDARLDKFAFPEIGVAVHCLPHAATQETPFPLLRADDRFKYNVLVVHAQVEEEWVSDFGGSTLSIEQLKPHEWDYIALGHVHLYRQIGLKGAYSGAIEHTAANIWAESREMKGFLEVHLASGKRIFHSLTTPREVVVLEPIAAEGLDPAQTSALIEERLQGVPGGVEGKLVRLEVYGLPREAYRYLDHRMLRGYRGKALNFTLDVRSTPVASRAADIRLDRKLSLKEELKVFCKEWDASEADKSRISEILFAYFDRTEAEYEAS